MSKTFTEAGSALIPDSIFPALGAGFAGYPGVDQGLSLRDSRGNRHS
jgi:hypothetical protein